MMVKVKYGISTATKHVSGSSITIGDVKRDPSLRAELGYSDNVRALVDGVEQPDEAQAPDGALIVMETRANQKA